MGVGSGAPAGGPQPASRAAVEALPTVEIGAAHAEKSCAICCEPFVPEIKGLPPFCPSLSLPPTLSRLSVPSPCLPPATSRLSCPCVCSVGAAVHAHLLRDVHPPVAAQEQFMPRLQARARNRDRSEPQTNAALESQNAAGGHSLAEPVVWMIVLQQRSRRRRGLLKERRKHPHSPSKFDSRFWRRRIWVQAGAGSDAVRSGWWWCRRRWAGQHHYLPDGRRRRQVCRPFSLFARCKPRSRVVCKLFERVSGVCADRARPSRG